MMNAIEMKLFIYISCFIAYNQGVTYEVITNKPEDEFECNSKVTIICKLDVNTTAVTWKISSHVKASTKVAAYCCLSSCSNNLPLSTCDVNPQYATKYNFTIDRLATNVTVMKITEEHDNLEFSCDGTSAQNPIKRAVVVSPNNKTMESYFRELDGENLLELRVKTSCVYPTENINFTWFSVKANGSNKKSFLETNRTVTLCNYSSDCFVANKSAHVTSILQIPRKSGSNEETRYKVLINYTSGSFLLEDSKFILKDTAILTTEVATNTAVSNKGGSTNTASSTTEVTTNTAISTTEFATNTAISTTEVATNTANSTSEDNTNETIPPTGDYTNMTRNTAPSSTVTAIFGIARPMETYLLAMTILQSLFKL